LYGWPLNDSPLAFATTVGLGVVVIVLIWIALRRTMVSRTEFDRLQRDLKELSDDVKGLMTAEQRRFLKELKAPRKDSDDPSMAA
jgi:hypothetical protein